MEEAEKSIESSYKEGYKQAVSEKQPEIEYYKTMYNEFIKQNRKDNIKLIITSAGFGLIIGSTTTIASYFAIKYLLLKY